MKKFILPLLLATILFGCNHPDGDHNSTVIRNIDSLMNYSYKNGLFNGTVLVSQNNKVIYRNAFGYANFNKNEYLLPESSFYLASVSKQFTTMAVMILKEKGKLTYDDKLSEYFPDFPAYANSVSIRQMMNHTSGIPDHYGLNAYKAGLTNDDVYDILVKQKELDFEPGSKYAYSNGGYVLLSLIVEHVSGQPFPEFMNANIFAPLKMSNTLVYDVSEPKVSNRAIGYNASGKLDDYEIFTTGDGGIYSTIDDLFKWDQGLANHQLVSRETLSEAYQPTLLTSGDTSKYGFGWGINQEAHWVGHSGNLSGFRTYLRRYLDNGNAFILLTNKGDAVAVNPINTALDNILAEKVFELPEIPFSNNIANLIESEGIDKAIERVLALKANAMNEFVYDEVGVNVLGYSYLQKEEMDIALKLFKLNIEIRPNSSNAYDSYADALLANTDTVAAIENYSTSLTLNPNRKNSLTKLTSLGVDVTKILPTIKLSTAQLDAVVGKYEVEPDFILHIIREGDQLFIHPSGQNKSELFPITPSRFYSKIVDAQITFNSDKNGQLVSLTLHQDGDHDAPLIK